MTALFIALGAVAFLLLLAFLPITLSLRLDGGFKYNLRLFGICVYNSERPHKIRKRKSKPETAQATPPVEKKEDFFTRLKKEKGFASAVQYLCGIAKIFLQKFLWLLKRMHFKLFKLDITVASDNAAKTAVEYGAVCAAVYPVLALADSTLSLNLKGVNVSSDFNSTTPDLKLRLSLTAHLITLTAAALACYNEYRKFVKESEKK